jgi:putative ABC transport system permease protein
LCHRVGHSRRQGCHRPFGPATRSITQAWTREQEAKEAERRAVTQMLREIARIQVEHRAGLDGVRMALGAQPGEILRMILGQGVGLACGGAALGLVVSLISSRLLRNQLFHVSPFDPLTFALMAGVLIAAALLASWIPARRATRVDPIQALRQD